MERRLPVPRDDGSPTQEEPASLGESATMLASPGVVEARAEPAERARPGQWIGGRYLAVRRLGEGGIGSVWEVEHEVLGKRFALKLLRPQCEMSEAMLARFQREARVAASIEHPNVVRVVDFHVDPALGPYIVMELLLGESLASMMARRGPMTVSAALEWIVPIAHALDAIHERGLVHRDVKPENIVGVLDGSGATKLVDFGLAAHADGRDRITRKGTVVGTPHYMAPEAAEGAPATAASDIYSLGVVTYELLTGSLPHEGDSALAILSAKLSTPPPSLTEKSGRMFTVPLEAALQDALHIEPARRPATATQFARRLALCTRR